MNRVVAQHPERELHVVLANLSTHSPSMTSGWSATPGQFPLHTQPCLPAGPGGSMVQFPDRRDNLDLAYVDAGMCT
jgi:hypothetical protein